ncbi:hypothetical protein ES708_27177 [subsurface metagenome]
MLGKSRIKTNSNINQKKNNQKPIKEIQQAEAGQRKNNRERGHYSGRNCGSQDNYIPALFQFIFRLDHNIYIDRYFFKIKCRVNNGTFSSLNNGGPTIILALTK